MCISILKALPSDSKETRLIMEPFHHHIILAGKILENTGLGNNHNEEVIRFLEALNHFPRFVFINFLLPVSV